MEVVRVAEGVVRVVRMGGVVVVVLVASGEN